MTKQQLIHKTSETLSRLSIDRIKEVSDFADFILAKHEDEFLKKGAVELMSNSKTFDFLNEEEELYTISDVKEKF